MAFNAKNIAGLIQTESRKAWQNAVAFTVLYRLKGVEKPGAAIKTFAPDAQAVKDHKTMVDAIRGAWPYAGKFYDIHMTPARKDEILALNTSDARDAVLADVKAHMLALGIPEGGRSAYFAVIHHADAKAVEAEIERNAKAAAGDPTETETETEATPAANENDAVSEPVTGVDAVVKVVETFSDEELADLMARLNAIAIARAEIAALIVAQDERKAA